MLQIIEKNFTRNEHDCIARNFEFALRDDSQRTDSARYYLARENSLAHVCTRDRDEFDTSDVRIIATSVRENVTQYVQRVKCDQIRTFANAQIDSREIYLTTIIHFSFVRREVRTEIFAKREMLAEYEDAYDASLEYDLVLAQLCDETSDSILRKCENLRKLIRAHTCAKSEESIAQHENAIRDLCNDLQIDASKIL